MRTSERVRSHELQNNITRPARRGVTARSGHRERLRRGLPAGNLDPVHTIPLVRERDWLTCLCNHMCMHTYLCVPGPAVVTGRCLDAKFTRVQYAIQDAECFYDDGKRNGTMAYE